MHPDLFQLERADDFDRLLDESSTRPLVLFKHSRSCGTSAYALDELLDHLHGRALDIRYALVIVQTHRELSSTISRRLGVRHETPQVLLIQDGRVVWSASHFRVTADAVEQAISAHLAAAQ